MLSRLIATVVGAVVGFSLIAPIKEMMAEAVIENPTITAEPAYELFKMVPTVFAIAIVLVTVAQITSIIRDMNLTEEYREEYEEEVDPKKQTYEEFVRERLRVERMMRYGWIGRWI